MILGMEDINPKTEEGLLLVAAVQILMRQPKVKLGKYIMDNGPYDDVDVIGWIQRHKVEMINKIKQDPGGAALVKIFLNK